MSIIREFARFIEPTGELEYDNTVLNNLSASTIQSAIDELSVLVGAGNVGSQATFSVYEFVATASQTTFDLAGTFTLGGDITAGNFVIGETYKIQTLGDTDWNVAAGTTGVTYNVGDVFTADAVGSGTGVVRVAVTYPPGYIQVFVNGIFMAAVDYTASNGRTVVLAEPAELSDLITVVILDSFDVATQLRVLDVNASAPDNSLAIDNVGDVSVVSDIKLADNGKVIFGDSSDLQIYHDGSASFINDSGTGNLKIQGTQLQLQNAAGTLSYLAGVDGGATSIHYAGFIKLATTSTGIDVTGTVTADGLTVDGLTQLNTNNLANGLTISGNDNANVKIRFDNTGTGGGDFVIQGGISGASNEGLSIRDLDNSAQRIYISPGGDISFYDTSANQGLFWDASAASLGIGTASPEKLLHLKTSVINTAFARIESTAVDSYPTLSLKNDAREYQLTAHGPLGDVFTIYDGTAGSHRLVIDSAGNVGIGTTSPSAPLDIVSSATGGTTIELDNTSTGGRNFTLYSSGSGNSFGAGNFALYDADAAAVRLLVDSSGNVGIGVSSLVTGSTRRVLQVSTGSDGGQLALADSTTEAANPRIFATNKEDLKLSTANTATGTIQFITGSTPTERMRIDSSGRLIVGHTSLPWPQATSSASITAGMIQQNGSISATTDQEAGIYLNRTTDDGALARFYKDGTEVGSIGTLSSKIYVGSDDTSLFFDSLRDALVPHNASTNAARSSAIDLGRDVVPFKDLYLSGSVVHTFDVINNGSTDYQFSDAGSNWFPTAENDPVLYLRRGETYIFDVNASGHPFEIRVSNGGAAYSTGVTGNATQVGQVIFKVSMSAPSTLYYQCTVHSGMGNTINIV